MEMEEKQEQAARFLATWLSKGRTTAAFCRESGIFHAWGGARYIVRLYGSFRAWRDRANEMING